MVRDPASPYYWRHKLAGFGFDANLTATKHLDHRTTHLETLLFSQLAEQRDKRAAFDLLSTAAGRAKQVMALVGMVGMNAGQIGLGGLEPVYQANPHEKVEMAIDRQWRQLLLKPLFQRRHQLVGGHGAPAGQQFGICPQARRGEAFALLGAALFSDLLPFRRGFRHVFRGCFQGFDALHGQR